MACKHCGRDIENHSFMSFRCIIDYDKDGNVIYSKHIYEEDNIYIDIQEIKENIFKYLETLKNTNDTRKGGYGYTERGVAKKELDKFILWLENKK